ncbi:TRI14-like protein [Metarhizium acridum CQMa 102]|uniref:TRI14-like protein n=1 Tax=Metarhizium acridum (strain CQMa 102) TaxID=655827 RepID=E9DUA7_METAQ|nr:TRI14-like protein [Metarhizium acridum CQMa 102]EFY92569.1 TRI14-like protein [Metarhizium acridum CQMa 102]
MFGAAVTILLSAGLGAIAAAVPAAVGGDFNVTSPQLYPEKCVFDQKRTVLYCSELYESKIAVIDLKTNTVVKTIDFPGLSGNADYHASGILLQGPDRLISSINTGAAFETTGRNISGTNFLLITDLETGQEKARVDVTAVTKGAYGGPQDFAVDTCGNIYEVFTYPGAIIKVTPSLKVIPWHLSGDTNATKTGFTGIVSNGNLLLASNQQKGGTLVRFNAGDATGQPFEVPIANNEKLGDGLDGISLPAKYQGTVLLVTTSQGGTSVFRSKDGKWNSAEKLGTVPNPLLDKQGFSTIAFDREDRIYSVFEWFLDSRQPPNLNGLSGNRTVFPFQDITDAVDKLVQ